MTLTADQGLAGAVAHHALAQPGSSILGLADDLVGLHNTSPAGPYLSLRARLPGFKRTDLDELMYGEWALARFRAMRLTMFVFPTDLLEIAASAIRRVRESLAVRWLRDSALTQPEFDRIADAVDEALVAGPLTVRALRSRLEVPKEIDLPGVVGRMCDIGRLVGGAPPRSWRSPVRQYHRWRDVLGDVDLDRWHESAAVAELVRRYVRSYGPVTVDDISWWTGITKARCRAALDVLDVVEVAVADWPGPLYRIAGDEPGGDLGSGVTTLPLLDPYVQGYRDRDRFLAPDRFDYVYDGGGNSAATLVHRGRIIGVWQFTEKPTASIRYYLFSHQPRSVRDAAEADLAAAGALYFDREVDVVAVPDMKPLSGGGGRSAMHPLDDTLHRAGRKGV